MNGTNKRKFHMRKNTKDAQIYNEVILQNEYKLPLLNGMTVLDIGAHIGCCSILAVKHGASKVIACEPTVANYELATANLKNLDHCEVKRCAVWRSDIDVAEIPIDCSSFELNTGSSSCVVGDPGIKGIVSNDENTIMVPAVSLDTLIEEYSPDLIKLDCEGAEYPILYSSKLLHRVPYLVGELHTWPMDVDHLAEFKGRMDPKGFKAYLDGAEFISLITTHPRVPIGMFWAARKDKSLSFFGFPYVA